MPIREGLTKQESILVEEIKKIQDLIQICTSPEKMAQEYGDISQEDRNQFFEYLTRIGPSLVTYHKLSSISSELEKLRKEREEHFIIIRQQQVYSNDRKPKNTKADQMDPAEFESRKKLQEERLGRIKVLEDGSKLMLQSLQSSMISTIKSHLDDSKRRAFAVKREAIRDQLAAKQLGNPPRMGNLTSGGGVGLGPGGFRQ